MAATIDLNDVPFVSEHDLMRVMQKLIATENGLIFLKGLNDNTLRALEDAIWSIFGGDQEKRLAVLVRFQGLVGLFASRRIKDLFTLHGLAILAPAFAVAARQRLNTRWGFNPQSFLMSVARRLNTPADIADAPEVTHRHQPHHLQPVAQLAA